MTVREMLDFLSTIEDKEARVEMMNVYGETGSVEHIQEENGKVVIY